MALSICSVVTPTTEHGTFYLQRSHTNHSTWHCLLTTVGIYWMFTLRQISKCSDEFVINMFAQFEFVFLQKKIRLLLTCGHLQCVEQADTFLQILDMDDLEGNITLADILESVKSCSNLSRSISYLQQECQLCLHHFSASQVTLRTVRYTQESHVHAGQSDTCRRVRCTQDSQLHTGQ